MKNKELSGTVYPLSAILFLLVAAELILRAMRVPAWFLPTPTAVAQEFWSFPGLLLSNSLVTLLETLLGFAASIVIGFVTAIVIVWSVPIGKAITPLLVLSQTFPKIAVAPLFIIWLGFGIAPKIAVSFLTGFFPVVVATVEGLKDVQPEKQDLLKSMGASGFQEFLKVRIPTSLPYFFAGARVSVALSIIGAVVGEFIGSDQGLGYLILRANNSMDTKFMFACFVVLAVMGYGLYILVERVERVLIPWHSKIRVTEMSLTAQG